MAERSWTLTYTRSFCNRSSDVSTAVFNCRNKRDAFCQSGRDGSRKGTSGPVNVRRLNPRVRKLEQFPLAEKSIDDFTACFRATISPCNEDGPREVRNHEITGRNRVPRADSGKNRRFCPVRSHQSTQWHQFLTKHVDCRGVEKLCA